ncbi:LysR family transcriptional regulator [Asanoa iriomotensis]|uniref:LysR family transcriptional regulator n=1 Tax=Asanoa iriomotensis TaxID=234613 RepID=UPI0019410331|nr:LysR family transcriptional regulator [Asanoa iriomotensis]
MLVLERLRVLHAVAAAGSVVGAARTLHVTTSAVSQQIARLEREVGQPLVERHGRGIRLTGAGAVLAAHAEALLDHAERVSASLEALRGAVTGRLTVSAFATAARGLLPLALAALRASYPLLTVSMVEQEPHEAVPLLARGLVDVAVVQDWASDPLVVPAGLARRHLLVDPFDVALPVSHPLADRSVVSLASLATMDWIGWSAGQICHDWLVVTLRSLGAAPRIVHTASEHATQLALVAAGLGAAVIPRLGRGPLPAGVRCVPISPAPSRRVFALWRSSAGLRPSVVALVDQLEQAVGEPEAVAVGLDQPAGGHVGVDLAGVGPALQGVGDDA